MRPRSFTCIESLANVHPQTIIEYAQQRAAAKAEHRPAPPLRHGIGAAVGLFLLTVFASLCQHQWFWRSMSLGISVRSALINSLHTRGLALSPKSRTTHSNAALVNHLSTDTSRIDYLCQWSHPVSGPNSRAAKSANISIKTRLGQRQFRLIMKFLRSLFLILN